MTQKTVPSRLNPAKTVKRVRKRLGLSQGALSRTLRASTAAVQHWERGHSQPDLARLLELRRLCPAGLERRELDALIERVRDRAATNAGQTAPGRSTASLSPSENGGRPTPRDAAGAAAPKGHRAQPSARKNAPHRDTDEMTWLVQNSRKLERYRGEWLLLAGAALVAHDRDFRVLQAAIAARKIDSPFVYYVPTAEESNFVPV